MASFYKWSLTFITFGKCVRVKNYFKNNDYTSGFVQNYQ